MVTDISMPRESQHPLNSKRSIRSEADILARAPMITIRCNGMKLNFTQNQIQKIAAGIKRGSYFIDLDS